MERLLNCEIVRHGCEYPDFFAGCGVAFTEYEYVVTGVSSESEEAALVDALEQIATAHDVETDDLDEIENEWSKLLDIRPPENNDELWHVSIRYSLLDVDELFGEFFKQQSDWIDEYVQTDDYCGEYGYLMKESPASSNSRIEKYIRDLQITNTAIPNSLNRFQELRDNVWQRIVDGGEYEYHVVDEYSSESTGYLDSFHIGEYEDQIEWRQILEYIVDNLGQSTVDIWSESEWLSIFDNWIEQQRDYCIQSWPHHSKENMLTGGTFYLIVNTGYRVDYVIPDNFDEIVAEEICNLCRLVDSK